MEEYEDEFDEDSMPCPCEKCGSWFDLTDGYGSELWFPNIVICQSCHYKEVTEIRRRDAIAEAIITIKDSEHTLKAWKYIKGEEEEWE